MDNFPQLSVFFTFFSPTLFFYFFQCFGYALFCNVIYCWLLSVLQWTIFQYHVCCKANTSYEPITKGGKNHHLNSINISCPYILFGKHWCKSRIMFSQPFIIKPFRVTPDPCVWGQAPVHYFVIMTSWLYIISALPICLWGQKCCGEVSAPLMKLFWFCLSKTCF